MNLVIVSKQVKKRKKNQPRFLFQPLQSLAKYAETFSGTCMKSLIADIIQFSWAIAKFLFLKWSLEWSRLRLAQFCNFSKS